MVVISCTGDSRDVKLSHLFDKIDRLLNDKRGSVTYVDDVDSSRGVKLLSDISTHSEGAVKIRTKRGRRFYEK